MHIPTPTNILHYYARFTGIDSCDTPHCMDIPGVSRTDYQIVDISEQGVVPLINLEGVTRGNLRLLTEDLGERVTSRFEERKPVTSPSFQ